MSDYADEIKRNLERLDIDELVEKLRSDNLTEVAYEIALTELNRRGVDLNNYDATAGLETLQGLKVSTPEELAVLRKNARPKILIGSMAFVFIFRIIEHFAMGSNTLGTGVKFAVGLFGSVVFGGLFWGYIVWWVWSRWRYR